MANWAKGSADRAETLQLGRWSVEGRGQQHQADAVDHSDHVVGLAVEVQRPMLEVLHDPLRFGDLPAGGHSERTSLVAQRRPA